jgi:transposase-like protein
MRTSRFTEEQITLALRQADAGTPVDDICRKLEITETTFYRWKRKYGRAAASELSESFATGVPEWRSLHPGLNRLLSCTS